MCCPWPFIGINTQHAAGGHSWLNSLHHVIRMHSWLASFLAAQMDQQKWSCGKIVPRGPRWVRCYFHCGAISVILIDLYHLHWHGREQTHSSQIPLEHLSAKQFSRSCVWSIFYPPGPDRGLIFNQQLLYFWQGGKPGQGVPLNGSNLEKWIEPGSLMAPCGSGELWVKWFIQRYLAEVILAFTLMYGMHTAKMNSLS